ncbi:hypothetical protein PINS_up010845 [Pythium insidiosum]|nr:hypothetical protein PINS_up010845 [Pythium insidiosum]
MATTMMAMPPASSPPDDNDDEARELDAWTQDARRYLAKDVDATLSAALQELERIDFLWGRIRLSKLTLTPAIKADIRVEGHLVVFTSLELKLSRPSRNAPVMASLQQYCVLNQILEFHSVMQTQLSALQATRDFLSSVHEELERGGPACDVSFCLDVLQKTHVDLVAVCRQLRSASKCAAAPESTALSLQRIRRPQLQAFVAPGDHRRLFDPSRRTADGSVWSGAELQATDGYSRRLLHQEGVCRRRVPLSRTTSGDR